MRARSSALELKRAEMSGRKLIRHGKYKGMLTFEQLAACDKDYVSWCLRSETLPLSLKQFARWVKQEHGGMLSVGKYKNMYFNEVIEHHPDYAVCPARLRGTQNVNGRMRLCKCRVRGPGLGIAIAVGERQPCGVPGVHRRSSSQRGVHQ